MSDIESTIPPELDRFAVQDLIIIGVVYFVLALFAIHLAQQPDAITNVWFANAAAMAALVRTTHTRWPGIITTMMVANLAANLVYRNNLMLSLSFVPGNVIEVLIGAWLIRRYTRWQRLDNDFAAFTGVLAAGALIPELIGATLGALMLQWHGFATFRAASIGWYVGSVIGSIAVLPLALLFSNTGAASAWRQLTAAKSLLLLAITIGFGLLILRHMPFPMVYLSLPLSATAILATPLVTLALCFVTAATASTALAYGFFKPPVITAEWQHVLLYLPLAAALVPAQLLAIVMARRRILVDSLAAVNSVTTDITAFCDKDGILQRINRAYEEYFQCTHDMVQGRPFEESIPASLRERVRRSFELALRGQKFSSRLEVDFPGPGKRVIDFSYEPAHDADGQTLGVVFAAHDVTELVTSSNDLKRTVDELTDRGRALDEARHRAESADQIKSAFLATMSHELRTPLNSIIGFTGIILQGLAGPLTAEQNKQLNMVRASARHLLSLINDVLDLSKIEARQLEIASSPMDLAESIEKVISLVQPMADKKGLALRANISTGLVKLVSDERRIEQVLLNLLNNAIKFTDRGEVTLHAELIGGDSTGTDPLPPPYVRLRVDDTGIGIRPENLANLFQPFQQIDNGLSRSHEGTGLGLAICRRLTELMGGTIEAESRWQKGSCFTVTLPLHPRSNMGST